MTRRAWTYALAAVLLAAGGTALFLALFERETVKVPLPPQGEARFNPLFALQKSLQAGGIPARSYPTLNLAAVALGKRDTLVLYQQPESVSPAQARRLVLWVQGGGHLLMPGPAAGETPGALAQAYGLGAKVDDDEDDDEEAGDVAFQCVSLGESAVPARAPRPDPTQPAKEPTRETVQLCGRRFSSPLPRFRLHLGDSVHGYHFGRLDDGKGVVTVVSSLGFLANMQLDKRIAGTLAAQVLAPRLREGTVHLVYSAEVPSLWRLLLVNGWTVLLPAALALLAWLLWRGQRLGPLQPLPPDDRRALLEHVQAAGEFAYRRGRTLALHSAVLALFKRRLAVRDPMLAALDGETLVAALAERFDLPAERVRRALQPIGLQRPDVFLHSVTTLVLMRNRL